MLVEQLVQEREPLRAPADPAVRVRQRELVVLALITLAAAALRFATLHVQSFDEDESVTLSLLHHTFGGMLGKIPGSEQTPPLYYALAWLWARIFGFGEVGLRSLSALAATLLVPVMYLATKALASRRAGLIAGALTALNPLLLWYSQEARAYALLALFSALAFLCFARVYADGRADRRYTTNLVLWGVFSALALATHYFAFFLIVPEALVLIRTSPRPRRMLWKAMVIPAAAALALAPLALYQRSPEKYSFTGLTPLRTRIVQIPRELLLGYALPHAAVLLSIVLVMMLVAGWLLLRGRTGSLSGRAAVVCLGIGSAALLVPLLMALAGVDLVLTRNFLAILVPFLVAAAIGLSRGRAGIAAAIAVCLVWLVAIVVVDSDIRWQRTPWRQAAAALGPATGPRAVVVVPAYRGAVPLSIYLAGIRAPSSNEPGVRELAVIGLASASGVDPIKVSSVPPIAGFVEVSRRESSAYTVALYRASRAVKLTAAPVLRVPILAPSGRSGGTTYGTVVVQEPR